MLSFIIALSFVRRQPVMKEPDRRYAIVALFVFLLAVFACAQQPKQTKPIENGQEAEQLPPPNATPSVNNGPKVVPRPAGAQLHVPPGFKIEEFASDLKTPRWMVQSPN